MYCSRKITVYAYSFNSWYKLLWDVGSDSLIFKLQLGVMLWLQWLKDPNNFTELPRTTSLLLMGEVKPTGNGQNIHILDQGDKVRPSVISEPFIGVLSTLKTIRSPMDFIKVIDSSIFSDDFLSNMTPRSLIKINVKFLS